MILVSVAQNNEKYPSHGSALPAHFLLQCFALRNIWALWVFGAGASGLFNAARSCGKWHLLSAMWVFFIPDRGLFIFPSDEKRICLG
jgi:hypothetical protein